MKWFYSLKKPLRIVIAVCAWLPLVVFVVIVGVVLYARADGKEEKPGDPIDGDQWTTDALGNLPPLGGE